MMQGAVSVSGFSRFGMWRMDIAWLAYFPEDIPPMVCRHLWSCERVYKGILGFRGFRV